ncbi:MAG: aminopeptidase [Hydrocarboniphaga sp.]|uniref:aminopeptidase n=1 Tax=Hydrocarboniphaga sp. TaxID=2033016 RepID=UPI00261E206E|nr:aminopeptidase [Hydrocarboniphaga sp.]MDB5972378.1 aminopeptidase [Hydrocarboniphaga sp.]
MTPRTTWVAAALGTLLTLTGCATTSYYLQLARGQYQLMTSREPIADVVHDPSRDTRLRERLAKVQDARRYAVTALHLPDNKSYTLYSDVHRDYVVWNVFATPEFSLDAVESCFPIAGCLAYRGFYDEKAAESHAADLRAQGFETEIGGVAAYSTLGWFNDPVINTMLRWSDAQLIGTLFHELGHQKLYVKNDTAFNESFANFVEQQGLSDYGAARGLNSADEAAREKRSHDFVELILDARQRLEKAYAATQDRAELRAAKQTEFDRLISRYHRLRDTQWAGYKGYDGFFDEPLNNARLLPFGLYDQWVPAFAALFHQNNADWPAFYKAASILGKLEPAARRARLKELAATEPRS